MTLGSVDAELTLSLPMERIVEACRRHKVEKLWLQGTLGEHRRTLQDDLFFLVDFIGNDFGPWGAKLDLLENDLAGQTHQKVKLAARQGVIDSTPSPFREAIVNSARLIYES